MFSIDFGNLPEKDKKNLSSEEIWLLNGLFQEPKIQETLEEIEKQRKVRQKWKYLVYGISTALALWLSFFFGTGEGIFGKLIDWFFFTIGSKDNSFSPVIWSTVISYTVWIGYLYSRFASKIEIPLKTEVLSRMCPLLYSKLEYSYDGKYSFDEIEFLRSKWFLASYDQLDKVEDSIRFDIQKDGKMFAVNGFELETSEVRGSGKNRRRVTTNHCYLLKVIFPNARIPLTDDLLITQDFADRSIGSKLLWPIIGCTMLAMFTLALTNWWIGLLVGCSLLGIIYYFEIRWQNTNRVKLENIEFEKLFDVKCTDQVTSRMIITPSFMDRIVTLVNTTGNQYEFVLRNNVMYIKRIIKGVYLEAGTEKNILSNVAGFAQFYTDIREIMLFARDMNLMYLSKTDTSLTIDAVSSSIWVTPLAFSPWVLWNNSLFSKFSFLQRGRRLIQ